MVTRPDKAFKMRKEILSVIGKALSIETRFGDKQTVRGLDKNLQAHVDFALGQFVKNGKDLYRTMLTHGLKLQDEQELMVDVLSMPDPAGGDDARDGASRARQGRRSHQAGR